MNYLRGKWNSGNITIVQLISWGVGLATFASSLAYASYNSTVNRVNAVEIKLAGQESTVSAMKDDIKEIKEGIKELLKK